MGRQAQEDSLLALTAAEHNRYDTIVAPSQDDDDEWQTLVVPSVSERNNAELSTKTRKRFVGRLLLLLVALLYGSLNVVLRWIYKMPGPPSASALSTVRGWMAVLCFLPFLSRNKPSKVDHQTQMNIEHGIAEALVTDPSRSLWSMAAELSFWNFCSQGLTNVGLLTTASAKAAFLTQTSVVMTPILSALLGHKVHFTVWIACASAMAGLTMLSNDGSSFAELQLGDLLCLAGAFCWSIYIYRLSECGNYDEIKLQAAKTFLMAVLYSAWCITATVSSGVFLWPGYSCLLTWAFLFYSALGPGSLADVFQQLGQATVSAAEANVVLSMEPVFTSMLGLLLLGERLSGLEIIGGMLIVFAALIATGGHALLRTRYN
jgi:drug/metabolite transporter (DMT)-like permease